MDTRVQEFGQSVKTLHLLQTGGSPTAILSMYMQFPDVASQYPIIGAYQEPVGFLGMSINSLWVVLNPSSKYYLYTLKLKSTAQPTSAYIADQGYEYSWLPISNYPDLLRDPYEYLQAIISGPVGPQGPQGPVGPEGPAGQIGFPGQLNYDAALHEARTRMCSLYHLFC